MYKIIVDKVFSRIEPTLPADVCTRLNNDLRYHPAGYQHTWYYKNKKWDGFNYLFNISKQEFRTGLVWRVGLRLKRDNIPYEIIDIRPQAEKISDLGKINFGNITPYQFQIEAAESTFKDSHVIVASPTGTGKTIMMQLMIKLHQHRTLIVVNSRTLLDQTFESFSQVVPGQVGIVGSGDFELGDVTIATIQSLGTILRLSDKQKKKTASWKEEPLREWLSQVGMVIHDEVHEADNSSVDKLYSDLPAVRFIGMTATPYAWAHATEKGKNLEMEQHFGRKIYDSRGEVDFISLGVTVPLIVNRPLMPKITKYINWDGKIEPGLEYKDVLKEQVINNNERTERLVKYITPIINSGMSCYIYYRYIEHGKKLMEAMSHLSPIMLQGSTARGKRKEIFQALNNKDQLLAISDIGSYGLNIKSLDCVVVSHPTRDIRQLKGRVCRSCPGKEYGLVVDPIDDVPFLRRHAQLRKNQYDKDGDTVIG